MLTMLAEGDRLLAGEVCTIQKSLCAPGCRDLSNVLCMVQARAASLIAYAKLLHERDGPVLREVYDTTKMLKCLLSSCVTTCGLWVVCVHR
mmetsp:Transcript_34120/g.89717  ORF Transcript_34120/g.89717 Transcript_34120/m.89717 type:complete len:91 (+) Transcript_34120:845-1117(+)